MILTGLPWYTIHTTQGNIGDRLHTRPFNVMHMKFSTVYLCRYRIIQLEMWYIDATEMVNDLSCIIGEMMLHLIDGGHVLPRVRCIKTAGQMSHRGEIIPPMAFCRCPFPATETYQADSAHSWHAIGVLCTSFTIIWVQWRAIQTGSYTLVIDVSLLTIPLPIRAHRTIEYLLLYWYINSD